MGVITDGACSILPRQQANPPAGQSPYYVQPWSLERDCQHSNVLSSGINCTIPAAWLTNAILGSTGMGASVSIPAGNILWVGGVAFRLDSDLVSNHVTTGATNTFWATLVPIRAAPNRNRQTLDSYQPELISTIDGNPPTTGSLPPEAYAKSGVVVVDSGGVIVSITQLVEICPLVNYEVVTQAQITANQDNYNLQTEGKVFRLSSDAPYDISGLANGWDGRRVSLINIGTFDLTILNQSSSSLASNRVITGTGSDFTLSQDSSIDLVYDAVSAVWYMQGGSGGGSSTAGTDLDLSGYLLVGATPLSATPPARIESVDPTAPQLRLTQAVGGPFANLQTDASGYLTITPSGNRTLLPGDFQAGAVGVGDTLTNMAASSLYFSVQPPTPTAPAMAGLAVSLVGQNGSDTTATGTVTGAEGGWAYLDGGPGGAASSATVAGTGGKGGAVYMEGGYGGAVAAGTGTRTGGLGGPINLYGGHGGPGATQNGNGGAVLVQGGAPGNGAGAAGVYGNVRIQGIGGSVIIGNNVNAPARRVEIYDATSPQVRLTQTGGTNYVDLQARSDGSLLLSPSGTLIETPANLLLSFGDLTLSSGDISGNGATFTSQVEAGSLTAGTLALGSPHLSGAHNLAEFQATTGEQLRLTYSVGTNYTDFVTDSGGDLTVTPSGGDSNFTGNVNVTGSINATTYLNLPAAVVTAPLGLGPGTSPPARNLDVGHATLPQLRLTNVQNTNYTDFQADSSGNLLINPIGGNVSINVTGGARFFINGPTPASVATTPGTAAPPLIQLSGGIGGNTTIATTGAGGAGASVLLTAGNGGQATAAATAATGGNGGNMTLTGGNGGASNIAGTGTNTGGNGSTMAMQGGTGGAATGVSSGTNQGGAGGPCNVIAGTGGAASGGSGGNVGATGGIATVRGGTGGVGATGGNGGGAFLTGGSAAAMVGSGAGAATVQGGTASNTGAGGAGGAINITATDAGGDNSANNAGGAITLKSGASRGSSAGGALNFNGGIGGPGIATTGATGGAINFNTGASAGKGGNNTTGGPGGPIGITAGQGGDGSTTNGSGGSVTINGGAVGAGAGSGGSVGNVLLCTLRGYVGIGNTNPQTQMHQVEAQAITGNLTDGYAAGQRMAPGYTAAGAQTVSRHNYFDLLSPSPLTNVTVTDATIFRFNAAAGTHPAVAAASTKATPGTVNAWLKVNINGTVMYAPLYTSMTT